MMKAETLAPQSKFAIAVSKLSRRFGSCEAVRSVELNVPRQCVYGLLGINGAGKSTLIKMLMGHLRPSSGHFRILDLDLNRNRQ